MIKWITKGVKTGVVTTSYPNNEENASGISPGFPRSIISSNVDSETLTSLCPTNAFSKINNKIVVERAKCIHCYRCLRNTPKPMPWDSGFEWATLRKDSTDFPKDFHHSINILVVDAGDCGACLNELKLLNNPYYNMHRLGFFITPTPRKADVLVVVGPVTEHMKTALLKAYEAMPTPKKVMAVGACALSGGVFKSSFVTSLLSDILPVDVEIPGCPPPPLAILHGLLVLAGRKMSDQSTGQVSEQAREKGGAR